MQPPLVNDALTYATAPLSTMHWLHDNYVLCNLTKTTTEPVL